MGVYDILDDFGWAQGEGNIHTGYLDVTNPESWEEALADFTAHTGGRLDAMVNNAGILYAGSFTGAGSYAQDSTTVDVNVKGVMYGARAAYPYLRQVRGSRLVNLASASAIYGIPDLAVYSASKFAVRGITEALEQEWEEEGIIVSDVWPLFARTALLHGVSTTSTSRLGVRLEAEDVALAVANRVEEKRSRPVKVHQPVGLQTKILYALSNFSPNWLVRYVNAKLTTDRKIKV